MEEDDFRPDRATIDHTMSGRPRHSQLYCSVPAGIADVLTPLSGGRAQPFRTGSMRFNKENISSIENEVKHFLNVEFCLDS